MANVKRSRLFMSEKLADIDALDEPEAKRARITHGDGDILRAVIQAHRDGRLTLATSPTPCKRCGSRDLDEDIDACDRCHYPQHWQPVTPDECQVKGVGQGPKYHIVIDLESKGRALCHPINGLGLYVGPMERPANGPIYTVKRRWALAPLPGQFVEPACMEEFWSRFPDQLAWFNSHEQPARVVLTEFIHTVKDVVRQVGVGNLVLATDCPDFDIGRLDQLLYKLGVCPDPIRYLGTETRHSCDDASERIAQLSDGAWDACEAWIMEKAPHSVHSHFPDEDAEHEYWQLQWLAQHEGQWKL